MLVVRVYNIGQTKFVFLEFNTADRAESRSLNEKMHGTTGAREF